MIRRASYNRNDGQAFDYIVEVLLTESICTSDLGNHYLVPKNGRRKSYQIRKY